MAISTQDAETQTDKVFPEVPTTTIFSTSINQLPELQSKPISPTESVKETPTVSLCALAVVVPPSSCSAIIAPPLPLETAGPLTAVVPAPSLVTAKPSSHATKVPRMDPSFLKSLQTDAVLLEVMDVPKVRRVELEMYLKVKLQYINHKHFSLDLEPDGNWIPLQTLMKCPTLLYRCFEVMTDEDNSDIYSVVPRALIEARCDLASFNDSEVFAILKTHQRNVVLLDNRVRFIEPYHSNMAVEVTLVHLNTHEVLFEQGKVSLSILLQCPHLWTVIDSLLSEEQYSAIKSTLSMHLNVRPRKRKAQETE